MPKSPQFLAKRLRAEGEKMTAFFAALSDADWNQTVYTEGETWTIRNVLVHFVTAEESFLRLFASILEGGEGAPKDFDIDRYNARQQEKSQELSNAALLARYQDIRTKMADWVEGLSADDLAREGRHPFLKETTLEEMIKMVYRHNQIHYRDMRS